MEHFPSPVSDAKVIIFCETCNYLIGFFVFPTGQAESTLVFHGFANFLHNSGQILSFHGICRFPPHASFSNIVSNLVSFSTETCINVGLQSRFYLLKWPFVSETRPNMSENQSKFVFILV